MSQLTEREQRENTDEGKSVSGKDCFDDQALETQSCTDSISELEEEVNENQQKTISDLEEEVNKVSENQQKIISDLEEEVNENQQKTISDLEEEVNKVNQNQQKTISDLEEKVNKVSENQQKIISDLEEKVKVNENQQKRISDLEEKVNKVSENQQKRISDLEEKVKVNENQQKIISKLEEKLNEAERKMNLWLYGLQEQEGENVKRRVIDICRKVAPWAANIFPLHIDTVQRIGKKGEGKVRPVIIRFIARSTKELLWKTSNTSEFYLSSSLKFAEDLTLEDKDTRIRLWPLIEAARKQGKIAFFAGASAIINGKEIRE